MTEYAQHVVIPDENITIDSKELQSRCRKEDEYGKIIFEQRLDLLQERTP